MLLHGSEVDTCLRHCSEPVWTNFPRHALQAPAPCLRGSSRGDSRFCVRVAERCYDYTGGVFSAVHEGSYDASGFRAHCTCVSVRSSHFWLRLLGCHCGGQCRQGVLCYPVGGFVVGADAGWIPRGALCSAVLEWLAVHRHVRLFWLGGGWTEGAFVFLSIGAGLAYSFYTLWVQCLTEKPQPFRVQLKRGPASSASLIGEKRALVCGYVCVGTDWALALRGSAPRSTLVVLTVGVQGSIFVGPCKQVQVRGPPFGDECGNFFGRSKRFLWRRIICPCL